MFQKKLNELIAEHATLKVRLNELPKLWQSQEIPAFKDCLEKLLEGLNKHHASEMEKIFSRMQNDPRLPQGGPMCTFFFDARMTFQPLRIVEEILAELKVPFESPIPIELKEYFDKNSPLTIPLEEHIAQKLIVQTLLGLTDLKNRHNFRPVTKAISFLQDVSNSNFAKEERCLFEFARQLLPP